MLPVWGQDLICAPVCLYLFVFMWHPQKNQRTPRNICKDNVWLRDSSRVIQCLIMAHVYCSAFPGERQRDTTDCKSLLRPHSHSIFSPLVYWGCLPPLPAQLHDLISCNLDPSWGELQMWSYPGKGNTFFLGFSVMFMQWSVFRLQHFLPLFCCCGGTLALFAQ